VETGKEKREMGEGRIYVKGCSRFEEGKGRGVLERLLHIKYNVYILRYD